MKDGHMGRIAVANHRINSTLENIQPVRSAPYEAGAKAKAFERIEMEKVILRHTIELVQT